MSPKTVADKIIHNSVEWMIDPTHWQEIFSAVLVLSPITTLASLYFLPDSWRVVTYLDFCVALGSIAYWFYPIKGWRRTFDQLALLITLNYHYYLMIYHAIWVLPIYLVLHWTPYFLSWNAKSSKEAVYWWICLHCISHIGNFFLYGFVLVF